VVIAKSVRDATAVVPAACYDNPTWKGLAYLARDVALYAAALAALLASDHPVVLLAGWALGGLAVSALFVLAHDAAHGALFRSPRLSDAVARLAFLPSLHALAAWQAGHNRVHHGHTGRRGIDFVWHPLTAAEYARLPAAARWRHRLEWSAAGAGLYYARAVWWARMMRIAPPPRFRAAFRRDRATVVAFALAAVATLAAAGYARYGTWTGAAWTVVKVGVVPWLVFTWIVGVTVYVQHIHPDVAWHSGGDWSPLRAQVDGTATWRVPAWLNVFWHNVYVHAPHHLDPRIPFYHLPRAAAALEATLGDGVRPVRLRLRDYVATTRRCKLYDFERGRWTRYGAGPVSGTAP
jgi:acyl-lipid omega-6 desaturase (Delta-12 desaturase)